jgi:hypothetical protein
MDVNSVYPFLGSGILWSEGNGYGDRRAWLNNNKKVKRIHDKRE